MLGRAVGRDLSTEKAQNAVAGLFQSRITLGNRAQYLVGVRRLLQTKGWQWQHLAEEFRELEFRVTKNAIQDSLSRTALEALIERLNVELKTLTRQDLDADIGVSSGIVRETIDTKKNRLDFIVNIFKALNEEVKVFGRSLPSHEFGLNVADNVESAERGARSVGARNLRARSDEAHDAIVLKVVELATEKSGDDKKDDKHAEASAEDAIQKVDQEVRSLLKKIRVAGKVSIPTSVRMLLDFDHFRLTVKDFAE